MILKTALTILLLSTSLSLATAAEPDQSKTVANPVDTGVSTYRKEILEAKDDASRAAKYKTLGDFYVFREDYNNAATEYIAAFSLSHDFMDKDRLKMAVAISWGDRLKEAIQETRLLLESSPSYIEARIHLARCLSWNGNLDEAITEADKALKVQPDNKDALLVKANALNWQGNQQAAIPIYRSLLTKEENFDARLGLANCLLTTGKYSEAATNDKLLHPVYPYQERELITFRKALKTATVQEIDINYSYYEDTDRNIVNRFGTGYSFWLGDFKLGLSYRHTAAHDNTLSNSANEGWLRAYTRLNSFAGVGAAIGVTATSGDNDRAFVNAQLIADFNIPVGTIGLLLAQETFIDTASLIQNRIRYRTAVISASQRITDQLSIYENYGFKDFSDNNNSHNVQISPVYTVYSGPPLIKAGYRFRYLNYDHQSGSGYFDPNDFMSHMIFVNASLNLGPWYGYVEPYGGYQSFSRNNTDSGDMFGGITGTVGYRFSSYLKGELNGEFGNYAVQTSSGFEYFQVGGKLIFSF